MQRRRESEQSGRLERIPSRRFAITRAPPNRRGPNGLRRFTFYPSKLETHFAQASIELGQDPTFVSQISRRKSHTEPQIMAGIIPRHRRDQLLGDEPL